MTYKVTLLVAPFLAFLALTSALPNPVALESINAPVVERDLVERSGPSGHLISPQGGTAFVSNGGIITFEYSRVIASPSEQWTATRSVNVYLIKRDIVPVYNHTFAEDLTFPDNSNDNIKAYFQLPYNIAAYPGFSSTYQLQVIESQVNPQDTSARYSALPFQAAAPYITVTFAG